MRPEVETPRSSATLGIGNLQLCVLDHLRDDCEVAVPEFLERYGLNRLRLFSMYLMRRSLAGEAGRSLKQTSLLTLLKRAAKMG